MNPITSFSQKLLGSKKLISKSLLNGFKAAVGSMLILQQFGSVLLPYLPDQAKEFIQSNVAFAADGDVDNTFQMGAGLGRKAYDVALQSDGKLLFAGSFTSYSGATANRIVRLNSNGLIDTGFVSAAGFDSDLERVFIQSDGKIIAVGGFTTYQGVAANRIIRLNSNGTRDSSFNIGGGLNNYSLAAAQQSDGKLLIGGDFTGYNGNVVGGIVRINSDGSYDNTFAGGAGFNGRVQYIAIQPDGKILVGGTFSTYKGVSAFGIVRINSDGSRDLTFNVIIAAIRVT